MLTFADDLRQDESAIQLICFRSYNLTRGHPSTRTPDRLLYQDLYSGL